MFWNLLGRPRVAGEDAVAFVAGEDRAPRAHHAGRVQILRVVFDVEQDYLLGNPVEDVLGAPPATRACTFLTRSETSK